MNPESDPVRILLIDDHRVLRAGLRLMLERQPNWMICGEASGGREGIAMAAQLKPDIGVLDISMGDMNGLDVMRQIKKDCPETEIIFFTAHEVEDLVQTAFENGARSFLLKTDESEHVLNAVMAAANHKPYFTPRVAEIVFSRFDRNGTRGERPEPGSTLTARERETLRLVAEGKSNKEIASDLGVSLRTAESHRAALMKKLGLNSVGEVVRFAIRNRIIEP